jgi:hypothetical protein
VIFVPFAASGWGLSESRTARSVPAFSE